MKQFLKTILLLSFLAVHLNSYSTDFTSPLLFKNTSSLNYFNEPEEDNEISKWEIDSLTSTDKNVIIIEYFPGEKRIDSFNKLFIFENYQYVFVKLHPKQSVELNYFWVNYHEKKESPVLPTDAEKEDFNINFHSEHNIKITQAKNGIIITNTNNYPVETYLGFEHGFKDINLFSGDVQKRIAYATEQKNTLFKQKNEFLYKTIKNSLYPILLLLILFMSLYTTIIFWIDFNISINRKEKHPKNRHDPKLLT
jgi:hypothetical protein